MKRTSGANNLLNICIYKNTCRILTSIIMVLGVLGCADMHSVRSGFKYSTTAERSIEQNERVSPIETTERIEAEPIRNEEDDVVEDIEKFVSNTDYYKANKNTTAKAGESKRKMPTLRELMRNLGDEQIVMKKDISVLQKDVEEIKNTLADIKDGIRILYDGGQPTALKGGGQAPANFNKPASENQLYKETYILSDEEIEAKIENEKNPQPIPEKKAVNKTKARKAKSRSPEYQPIVKEEEPVKEKPIENSVYREAMISFTRKDYNSTIQRLETILKEEKDPGLKAKCNYWLGEAHFGLKQYDIAIDHFARVLKSEKASKKPDAQVMIAEAHIRSGEIPKAIDAYRDLIKNYPSSRFIPRARKMLQQL